MITSTILDLLKKCIFLFCFTTHIRLRNGSPVPPSALGMVSSPRSCVVPGANWTAKRAVSQSGADLSKQTYEIIL